MWSVLIDQVVRVPEQCIQIFPFRYPLLRVDGEDADKFEEI